jgi:hypothetical protein
MLRRLGPNHCQSTITCSISLPYVSIASVSLVSTYLSARFNNGATGAGIIDATGSVHFLAVS